METTVRFIRGGELEQCLTLRKKVFVEEQGFPADVEIDEFDEAVPQRHIVLLCDGEIVGTARLRPLGNGAAKLQRICLKKEARGLGLGAVLMAGADRLAAGMGYTSVAIEAQQYAQGFYERCGFLPETGEVFDECGKPHLKMYKNLKANEADKMSTMDEIVTKPIFFERNRVYRVYLGGMLFHDFFGDEAADGHLPEEWIASSVRAMNKDDSDPKEGISRVAGTDLYFDELLAARKKELLGDRDQFDILVKVLDSAIRLPIQAHPDKAFSRKYFHSEFGKAEGWLVLATRPNAALYLGFDRKVSVDEFKAAIEASYEKKDEFTSAMNRIDVKPGDFYFIPANTVHAIGAGCMILEVQEPTDFTLQPEAWCGDYRLNDYEMYLGLDRDTALTAFDFETHGEKALAKCALTPTVLREESGVKTEEIIGKSATDCFCMRRMRFTGGSAPLTDAPAIYIVTDGSGTLSGEGWSRTVKQGDYFFLPHCTKGKFTLTAEKLGVAYCLPSAR